MYKIALKYVDMTRDTTVLRRKGEGDEKMSIEALVVFVVLSGLFSSNATASRL